MSAGKLFSRTPASLFVSPFGISGVGIGEDPDAPPAVAWEAASGDVDEASFGKTADQIDGALASSGHPTPRGDMLGQMVGAGGGAGREVTFRRTQSHLALSAEDGRAAPLEEAGSPSGSDPMYEKEIRRAEAHLPGVAGCEATCRTETISIGEKMTKTKATKKQREAPGAIAGAGAALPDLVAGTSGKDGWGVLSRNFAVSSALSSLNRDLKTFGTKPQEAAIDRERAEAVRIHRFLMVPGSVFHRRYSWLNIVLLLYCAATIPVRVSFDFELGDLMSFVEFSIDVFYMIDVFVNFRTGYIVQEDGEEPVVVTDTKMIAKHYFRTWFCVDTLSAIPINFFLGQETLGGANRVPRLIRIPRIIRLMRLIRLLRLLKLLQTTSVMDQLSSAGLHPRLLRALRLVFVTFIGSHVTACCWHFLHTLATSEDMEAPSWWNAYCRTALPDEHAHIMCEVDLQTRYAISLYWAVTTLTTIGYGDILPVTFSEYVYTIACMYVGVSFYAYIAANVATVLASLDTNTQLHNQKMDKLNEFLKATKMPNSLRRRLRKYFSLYWTQLGALMPYDTRKLIEEINLPALRSEVTTALYKDTLARVPFLQKREANFVTNVVTKMVPLHVLEGELVVREGEVGTNIFFLFHGKIASVYRERTVKYMVPGSYFGDVAVLLTERHLMSFLAHGTCDLYILSKPDLAYALQHFPHYTFEMRELAVSRLAAMNEDIEGLNAAPPAAAAAGSAAAVPALSTAAAGTSPIALEDDAGVVAAIQQQQQPAAAAADRRSSVRGSSVLSEMFDERLSERLSQLLPSSNDAVAAAASRGSRRSSARNARDDDDDDDDEREGSSDDFLARFLDEEKEEAADKAGLGLPVAIVSPKAKARGDFSAENLRVGHDGARANTYQDIKNAPITSSRARAQAKLDAKTAQQASGTSDRRGDDGSGGGGGATRPMCRAGADSADGLSPEQLLASRVLDATATISELMAALDQVLSLQQRSPADLAAGWPSAANDPAPLDSVEAADETLLTSVAEEEGEEEEEEDDEVGGEQQENEGSDDTDESSFEAAAKFAYASPPPPSYSAGRGVRGKPTPRGNKLRRKDTAAAGVLSK